MRKGFLGSVTALLAGAGLGLAQVPMPYQRPTMAPSPYGPVAAPMPVQPYVARPAGLLQPGQSPRAVLPPQPYVAPPPAYFGGNVLPVQGKDGQSGEAATPQASGSAKPAAAPAESAPGDCGPPCVPCCHGPIGLVGQFYGGADYLLFWSKAHHLPVIVATSPPGTLRTAGSFEPGTVVTTLFGGDVDDESRSGGRFWAGIWLTPEQSVALEGRYVFLEDVGTTYVNASNGVPILARPFVSAEQVNAGLITGAQAGPENALPVALAPLLTGSVNVNTRNQFWGVESNARINVGGGCNFRADVLAGFRYADIEDDLTISSVSRTTANPGSIFPRFAGQPVGPGGAGVKGALSVIDSFTTRNNFYGGQVGANIEVVRGRFFADLTGKLAIGVMDQKVNIQGLSVLTPAGGEALLAPGGLYALTTNLGSYSRCEFGLVPEVGVNLGYQFGKHLRAHVGYSVIYFRSNVVRPAEQIDLTVNANLVPALSTGLGQRNDPALQRPVFAFRDVDFWVQGVSAGLEFSF